MLATGHSRSGLVGGICRGQRIFPRGVALATEDAAVSKKSKQDSRPTARRFQTLFCCLKVERSKKACVCVEQADI